MYKSGLPFPVFALTGRSGSGKTTVAQLWRAAGLSVWNCDEIAREVLQNPACVAALAALFGQDIRAGAGVNRALLAERAFSSPAAAAQLTELTHPFIIESLLASMAQKNQEQPLRWAIADGSTIIGAPLARYCDLFFVMSSAEEKQVARTMARDNLSEAAIRKRLAIQTPQAVLQKKADYIIENKATLEELAQNAAKAVAYMERWYHAKKEQGP